MLHNKGGAYALNYVNNEALSPLFVSMKILIASKFFYTRGGAELVAINTRRMLMEQGHSVRVLAMSCPENIALEESESFPPQVSLFGSFGDKLKGVRRMLGMDGVREAVRRALDEFEPDVVHLHNVHSYLSPLVASEAHERGIRVVWTLHDYKLICPAYSCRRPDGSICEECFKNPMGVLRHRCMKNSLPASFVGYLEARRWNRSRIEKMVDAYIAPSAFMGQKMAQAGFDRSKIKVLCNFVDPDKLDALRRTDDAASLKTAPAPYFTYIGRLSAEKGVETMLRAAERADVALKVAGIGPLFDSLKSRYGARPGVDFLGHLDAPRVARLLKAAVASVLPSEWYENNPLGVIESLSVGTPVIGSRMGGIPELIQEGRDGFTYGAFDADALAELMERSLHTPFDRELIARSAASRFDPETHYERLMAIYRGK